MAIHVALHHKTHYKYDRLINLGPQVVRLRPAPHSRTRILSYSLKVEPGGHFINWHQDPQSNWNARLVFTEKTKEFCVEVDLVAEMAVLNPFDFFLEPDAERFPFSYDHALDHELAPFRLKCSATPQFSKYLGAVKRELFSGKGSDTAHESVPHSETPVDVHHGGGVLPAAGVLQPAESRDNRPRTIDFLVALNQRIWKDTKYTIRLEPGVQTPEETLQLASGSCRDSAWLLVQLLRHCGLAARFVSGYLIQLKPDVKSLDGPSGTEKDFTDLHAWCEVYLPGAGWIGLDPTSGLLAGEGHIPLAATPDPTSAAPISGLLDECKCEFTHEMNVTRIFESPRVTLPYTDEQWSGIQSLGHAIDADLKKNDVRLTMGGEPTFVSIDDPDGKEWNFTAVSHKKRVLSGELIKRLRRKFAPGSLLHYGQGKWYPGEQLPRWALGCYWRKDGVPIWKDDSLIADESKDYGHGASDAKALLERISRVVGADPKYMVPAYEDAFYYTWKERRLPSNVTPEKANLKDKLERDRIARIFQKGLGEVVGYALPIKRCWYPPSQSFGATSGEPGGLPRRSEAQAGWMSGAWFLRDDDTLWLIPGDSAMGLRLPLDSIPWVAEKEYPWNWQQDPSTPDLPQLPKEFPYKVRRPETTGQYFIRRRGGAPLPVGYGPGQRAQELGELEEERVELPPLPPEYDPNLRPVQGQSAPWIVRTAMCVEPRDGRLHVFMPPVATTEDYLDLVAGIETAVTEMGLPVIIEGETPPRDPRLNKLAVTPDPGVIEVNLHPSHSWDELVERTTVLYEEARLTRLGTEKFMLDGRHTGTGGGNHIIIGGETPSDSPILRRPDLLRSLITYWQNHPSLSWLFSGLFIGPTSQAPRIDEARNDSLYELDVAFKELERSTSAFGYTPPWLCDRLFRNLLVDSSGNTHRSEFSIDKLFSPESSAGRLGLVEMRAFEMPPHSQMSLAQHLLLRGLIAKFWNEPYKNGLVRWGTDIHDRWMLPHFCETDFKDVVRDLRDAGYPFEFDWFAPHFEFRFPFIGDLAQRDINIELRTALEPWHVLGEEPGGGGTVRYVDSSLERLQVKAQGLTGDRFAITVGGHRLPLHPTGTNGEFVAGVRYRAWQPPECLQPTIGVHTPLVFDVVDTWNGLSLGGCTYHVAHPGGRSHDTFPVNSYEAESRRLARFFRNGHSQGRFTVAPAKLN
ncbi:MAG TPA: transglutaminase family protein, partial [Verrucomicrobiota bacterium]|nr:transglutaminase family protein [Verrucomicrobiota bacterium]